MTRPKRGVVTLGNSVWCVLTFVSALKCWNTVLRLIHSRDSIGFNGLVFISILCSSCKWIHAGMESGMRLTPLKPWVTKSAYFLFTCTKCSPLIGQTIAEYGVFCHIYLAGLGWKPWKSPSKEENQGQWTDGLVLRGKEVCQWIYGNLIRVYPLSPRWREETESDAMRFQERLQQAERERVDAVTSLRKKVDSVEVVKANEISRLQEIHWWADGSVPWDQECVRWRIVWVILCGLSVHWMHVEYYHTDKFTWRYGLL